MITLKINRMNLAFQNDNFLTGMEPFKGLLKNKDFLLLFIRTLEQQKSFTIQDKWV